ncbi:flavin reductase family protein [Oricola thermophila]|uniref:Flavin reductase family protein n=1 Tax=Oricola thermophila TaxID=2742145 RepID=A0A6N1VBF9_9HYPH|nr:flavin reductase family protein [Oricola thermophila]QKV18351.1 flavin reductase family protein [Oricola thermophila]
MNADARLEIGEMDHADLKRAMGCFATGIAVVTTRHGGADLGMTCNSFNTVSLEPPLVLWSVRRAAASHDAFVHGGGYTVSILGADQEDIANRFTRGSQEERFADLPVERLPTGRLVIGGAAAWLDCSLENVVEAGDHDILIGRVLEFDSTLKDTLGYLRGRFTKLRS